MINNWPGINTNNIDFDLMDQFIDMKSSHCNIKSQTILEDYLLNTYTHILGLNALCMFKRYLLGRGVDFMYIIYI